MRIVINIEDDRDTNQAATGAASPTPATITFDTMPDLPPTAASPVSLPVTPNGVSAGPAPEPPGAGTPFTPIAPGQRGDEQTAGGGDISAGGAPSLDAD